ncbi:hypothetical protein L208DRAFT_1171585, partial [Tricholoma matsutake]
MNTINASTGFSPFMLKSAHSPHLIPPLTNNDPTTEHINTTPSQHIFNQLAEDLIDARDLLTAAKISQASQANKDRSPNPEFEVGDRVFLATAHRRRDYMQAKDGRVAK